MSLLYTHCARNHPTDSSVEFCFSDFDVMSHEPTTEERRVERQSYWAGWTREEFVDALIGKGVSLQQHFTHPKYRYLYNRPVMYRGNADSLLFFESFFGVSPSETLSLISTGANFNIYWVATNTPASYCRELKSWGFDAYTHYLIYPARNTWEDAVLTYRSAWAELIEIAKQTGLKVWIPTTSGFDSRAWYDHPSRFMPTPEQYESHVREATGFSRRNFVYTDGQVVHEAWSEFGEGSFIEPGAPDSIHPGTVMIDAFRRAVA